MSLHSASDVKKHGCPGCHAEPGEHCRTTLGKPTKLHHARLHAAMSADPTGTCPGCGQQLAASSNARGVMHEATGWIRCQEPS